MKTKTPSIKKRYFYCKKASKEKLKVLARKGLLGSGVSAEASLLEGQELRKCYRCKKIHPATEEYFYSHKGKRGGIDYLCKVCGSVGRKRQLSRDGLLKCYQCQQILPLTKDFFHSNKSRAKGLNNMCKKCANKRDVVRRNTPEYREKRKKYQRECRAKGKGKALKLRFEILKRDNFTCQYCGRKAPDVVLQIDHIIPKAKGGSWFNKKNLITSCSDCNLGKSDILLNIPGDR